MKTYHFSVDVLWMMHTTCEVQADSEEDARRLVMSDDGEVVWEGYLDWGDQERIVAAELTDVDEEDDE